MNKSVLFDKESDAIIVFLVEFNLKDEDLYFTNLVDEDIIYNGKTYESRGIVGEIPSEDETRLHTIDVRIDNVDQEMVQKFRTHTGSDGTASISLFNAENEEILFGPFNFLIQECKSVSPNTIEVTLGHQDFLNAIFPKIRFIPSYFPALFKETIITHEIQT